MHHPTPCTPAPIPNDFDNQLCLEDNSSPFFGQAEVPVRGMRRHGYEPPHCMNTGPWFFTDGVFEDREPGWQPLLIVP
jgi:hypothetical protein